MADPVKPPSLAPTSDAVVDAVIDAPPGLVTSQARNPLHGMTLETIVTALADYYGWEGLGQRIPVRCFTTDPSVGSSLKFLRKTLWARDKVESLYLFMLREIRRG